MGQVRTVLYTSRSRLVNVWLCQAPRGGITERVSIPVLVILGSQMNHRLATRVHKVLRVLGGRRGWVILEQLRRECSQEVESVRRTSVVQYVLKDFRVVVLNVFPHIGGISVGADEIAQATHIMAIVHHTKILPHPRRSSTGTVQGIVREGGDHWRFPVTDQGRPNRMVAEELLVDGTTVGRGGRR